MLIVAGGVVVLAAVAVAVALAFSGASSSGSLPSGTPSIGHCAGTGLPGCAEVERLFRAIPQNGLYLGSARAKAQMVIYVDLQCPYCQQYETTVMPTIVKKYVRTGRLRVKIEPWAFIGPDSIRGQRAALAAAMQDKVWNFAELLYLNQGEENTGWLNDSMVARAASSIDGLNVAKLWRDRTSRQVTKEASGVAASAAAKGVTGTPTVFVGKTGAKLTAVGANGAVPDLSQTEAAISAVA